MKFVSIVSLALFAYAALASPLDRRAASQAVQDANKADAQALNKKFATLNADSPCTGNENACVNGQFAQCSGGKFSSSPCAGGLQCFALPLVNSRGTSVTCDTKEDAIARGGILASGQGGNGNGTTGGQNPPKPKSKKKKNKCKSAKGGAKSGGGAKTGGAANGGSANGSGTNGSGNNGSTGGSDIASIRKQNAVDAQTLQDSFDKLNANSPCTGNENACVNGQFAQCSGGKFSLSPCAAGEQCFVLPLVNKSGTSVTCDTKADRDARFEAAKKGQ